jgi:hypothetical protein
MVTTVPPMVKRKTAAAAISAIRRSEKVAGTGFELSQESAGKSTCATLGGAEFGAFGAQNGPSDPELAAAVEAWGTAGGHHRNGAGSQMMADGLTLSCGRVDGQRAAFDAGSTQARCPRALKSRITRSR